MASFIESQTGCPRCLRLPQQNSVDWEASTADTGSPQLWTRGSPRSGAIVVWFLVRALSRCADGRLLTSSSHSSRMSFVLLLFNKDTQPIMGAPCSGPCRNQITPQRPCKLTPSHRGVGSSTYGRGGNSEISCSVTCCGMFVLWEMVLCKKCRDWCHHILGVWS